MSDAYRDLCRRYIKKYNVPPIDIVGQLVQCYQTFLRILKWTEYDGYDEMDGGLCELSLEGNLWEGSFLDRETHVWH